MIEGTIKNTGFVLKINKFLSDPSEALIAVLSDGVEYSRESFKRQKLGKGTKWKPRSVPNLGGIWSDAEAGRIPPSRRLDSRPALIDTGMLRRSITFQKLSATRGRIGTNRPNAKQLHEGGLITQKKTNPSFNQYLDKFVTQNKSKLTDFQIRRIYRLTSLSQLSIKVPARPFLGFDLEQANRTIAEILKEQTSGS